MPRAIGVSALEVATMSSAPFFVTSQAQPLPNCPLAAAASALAKRV